MKRKQLILCMTAVLLGNILTGCKGGGTTEDTARPETEMGSTGQESFGYRQGLGLITKLERAVHAKEKDGVVQINTIVAAVVLDQDNRVMKCTLDAVESPVSISSAGEIGSSVHTEFSSKKELGDSYGMKGASSIKKEWYEQAEAFEQYVVGKTVEEINDIATDEAGYAKDRELKASVSISISEFQAAITKAAGNAYE